MESRNGSAADVLVAAGAAPGWVSEGQFDGLPLLFEAGAGTAFPTGFAGVGATLVPLVVLDGAALFVVAAADWDWGVDGFLMHDRRTRRPVVVVVVVFVFVSALDAIPEAERSLFKRL